MNFLIIISDEHRRDAIGCAGHGVVKTPNIDGLAARGTLFSNAYTPSPMCVPTRAALACGDHVHKIRHWDSATPYDGEHKSWMHKLRDEGVHVASIGKLHFRSAEDDNGFSEEILPMHVVKGVGWPIGLLRKSPPPFHDAKELAADVGIGESTYTNYDLDITRAAEQWLGLPERTEKPWAAFISLVSPHYPLTAPEAFFNLYDVDALDLPVNHQNREAETPHHPEIGNLLNLFDYGEHFDDQKTREAIAAYFGLTSFMDNCVGRILTALEASGQVEDTMVLYVSDHGEMLGDHGIWTKQVMYEASVGVPMILSGPGIPAANECRTGTTLLDIASTASDIFELEKDSWEDQLPGQSLIENANAADNRDRTVFSEYHDGGSTTGTFMVRWQQWKYVHYVGYRPQLFNLDADPNELTDLASSQSPNEEILATLHEGERRLREICDPESVNQQCFSDQARRIEELGGEEACRTAYTFNHTPTPAEQSAL